MSHALETRPDETRALTRLALEELGGAAGGIGDIHRAVATRVFRLTGAGAAPVRVIHDAVSGAVYGTLQTGAALAALGADAALRTVRPEGDGRAVSASPRGATAIAILDGLIGDRLEAQRSDLAEPMALRVDGQIVPPEPGAIAAAFPAPTRRLVVFAHGLMESEHGWSLGQREPYGARLARDLGCTPVYVRYNTGRRISANGRSLAELLDALVAAWPVDVEQIALVGHSMGGLVARSACHQAAELEQSWVRRVRHVVSLGSPHLGAPLEQAVHYASAGLHRLPETRPLAAFLRRRSVGIRDLRQGSLVDADWEGRDPDALRAEACEEVPLLPGATHCFIAATVTRSDRHPVGRLIGDALVLAPSASGRSRKRRIAFREEHGAHIGGTHHVALLNHPQVYEKLAEWLATPPAQISD